MRVVFPAPGGACSTSAVCESSVDRTEGTSGSIGSSDDELEGVILSNAAADELLQQRVGRAGRGCGEHVRLRQPDVLHDHEQLLGVDALVAGFARRGAEQVVELVGMIAGRD